tara:strand:- start:968 stop:1771 length:804 start_codon:yes stop_codon:yes gene_type:complete
LKNNEKPIGIFDSGLGGLRLLTDLKMQFPYESFIYLGDTAHLPYGSKSQKTIQQYSEKIVTFLISKNVKMIIIACNTASSLASEHIKQLFNIPIIEVVTPCIQKAVKLTNNNRVGVIGTNATIQSTIYSQYIKKINNKILVFEKACPLLVPIIEEGVQNKMILDELFNEYFHELLEFNIDTLILGCTHYSIIEKHIFSFFNNEIKLITSSNSINFLVEKTLLMDNMKNCTKGYDDMYFVTDLSSTFKEQAKILLAINTINIDLINLV